MTVEKLERSVTQERTDFVAGRLGSVPQQEHDGTPRGHTSYGMQRLGIVSEANAEGTEDPRLQHAEPRAAGLREREHVHVA